MVRMSELEREELWDRWEAGESQRSISRRLHAPVESSFEGCIIAGVRTVWQRENGIHFVFVRFIAIDHRHSHKLIHHLATRELIIKAITRAQAFRKL